MYIHNTSACSLPDGYIGPRRISHNDEHDIEIPEGDDGSPNDIPPPSDNPIAVDLDTCQPILSL